MNIKLKLDNINAIAPYAMAFTNFSRVVYPARPELIIKPEHLWEYEGKNFIAQPKLNGSNVLVYLDANNQQVLERHGKAKTGQLPDFKMLHRGNGAMILNGEWMEKSKKDETGQNFNGNFIIFDILAYNGYILGGSTFLNRLLMLHTLYKGAMHVTEQGKLLAANEFLTATAYPGIFLINSYYEGFTTLYNKLILIDMYEGLVLKQKTTMLQPPFSLTANTAGQAKSRKPTKSYNS